MVFIPVPASEFLHWRPSLMEYDMKAEINSSLPQAVFGHCFIAVRRNQTKTLPFLPPFSLSSLSFLEGHVALVDIPQQCYSVLSCLLLSYTGKSKPMTIEQEQWDGKVHGIQEVPFPEVWILPGPDHHVCFSL